MTSGLIAEGWQVSQCVLENDEHLDSHHNRSGVYTQRAQSMASGTALTLSPFSCPSPDESAPTLKQVRWRRKPSVIVRNQDT
jgi:hypothetical protein